MDAAARVFKAMLVAVSASPAAPQSLAVVAVVVVVAAELHLVPVIRVALTADVRFVVNL